MFDVWLPTWHDLLTIFQIGATSQGGQQRYYPCAPAPGARSNRLMRVAPVFSCTRGYRPTTTRMEQAVMTKSIPRFRGLHFIQGNGLSINRSYEWTEHCTSAPLRESVRSAWHSWTRRDSSPMTNLMTSVCQVQQIQLEIVGASLRNGIRNTPGQTSSLSESSKMDKHNAVVTSHARKYREASGGRR